MVWVLSSFDAQFFFSQMGGTFNAIIWLIFEFETCCRLVFGDRTPFLVIFPVLPFDFYQQGYNIWFCIWVLDWLKVFWLDLKFWIHYIFYIACWLESHFSFAFSETLSYHIYFYLHWKFDLGACWVYTFSLITCPFLFIPLIWFWKGRL